jgi:hypothetical protein
MSDCTDSQEVGLETATLERVRNSSLVEWSGADNLTGLKHRAEAADLAQAGVVGERRTGREAAVGTVVEPARVRMLA